VEIEYLIVRQTSWLSFLLHDKRLYALDTFKDVAQVQAIISHNTLAWHFQVSALRSRNIAYPRITYHNLHDFVKLC